MKMAFRYLSAALALSGCATTLSAGSLDGVYRGSGLLEMTITQPAVRELPPESTNAMVTLASGQGGRMAANVRFNANGNQCTLVGTQYGSEFVLDPGQICRGLIEYERYNIDAYLRVTDARGAVTGATVSLRMTGTVDAEHVDGSRNLGNARWSMQGGR